MGPYSNILNEMSIIDSIKEDDGHDKQNHSRRRAFEERTKDVIWKCHWGAMSSLS